MKRIAAIVGGVVVVLIAGVFVALATIDINQYKGLVQDQAAAATGRTLTIEGELELSVSLSPAIVLNGVRFENAAWGSRPDMAVIERVEASVPLLPLIFGNVEVTRLALIKPDILLERNAQGQANWEFQSEESVADAEAEASALAISSIEIDDATLAFNDAQAKSDVSATLDRLRVNISGDLLAPDVRRVSLDNLAATLTSAGEVTEIAVSALELDAASGATDVSLDSLIAGQAIAAEGQVGPLGRLVTMDGDFPINLAEEELSLNIRPKAKEGLGVGMGKLTQAVKISGPLSNPGIGIDAAGAVRSLGSIAGAFATGGASLLAEGALERGQSSGDTCGAARTWHLAGD